MSQHVRTPTWAATLLACGWLAISAPPAAAVLPPTVDSPPTSAQREKLSHLLASDFAAAFNAKSAAKSSQAPTVVIGDNWGNGKQGLFSGSSPYINAEIVAPGQIDPNPSGLTASNHGYHVTGIALGSFANDGSAKGLVTGGFPLGAKLVPIDGQNDGSLWADETKFAPVLTGIAGRIVVNTSLSDGPDSSGAAAVDWIELMRQGCPACLENRAFHATAAGNDGAMGGSALASSSWSAAATRTDLQDEGAPVPRLTNTVSVENVEETGNASKLTCLNAQSNVDGSIAAPGTDVYSFKKDGGVKTSDGTSQASPLVAGLAAYLWSIDPNLSPQDLVSAMTQNPQAVNASCERTSAPLLDAYAATLSLDQEGAPTVAGYPVRMAILNVDGKTGFKAEDIKKFAPKVDEGVDPTKRNWSRFDLNGDGFTGGRKTVPFDLDRTGSTHAGQSDLDTVERPDEVEVDEGAVTDQDILCFYALSPLYTGGEDAIDQACDPTCEGREATIVRGSGNNTVNGTPGDDVIVTRGGDDTVRGRDGADRICTGTGKDRAYGEGGADTINAGSGNDRLDGGADPDQCIGGGGVDTFVACEEGPDCFGAPSTNPPSDAGETINGTESADVIHGNGGDDTINGLGGGDMLCGGDGDDDPDGDVGNDQIDGGAGADNPDGGADGSGEVDPTGVDDVRGGSGNDDLDGDGGGDTLRGGPGDDSIFGEADLSFAGGDSLYGEEGNDDLDGGGGTNLNDGGPGTDECKNPLTGFPNAFNCET